jgi:hypothetical protein
MPPEPHRNKPFFAKRTQFAERGNLFTFKHIAGFLQSDSPPKRTQFGESNCRMGES